MSCDSYTTCANCTAATGCHFCESDHKCHAYGSLYGCVTGMTCIVENPCIRTAPEFKGYGTPPGTEMAILISTCLFVIALLGVCAVALYCCQLKRSKSVGPDIVNDKAAAQDYLELDTREKGIRVEPEPGALGHSRAPRRKKNRGYRCCQCCILLLGVLVLTFMILGICFFPQLPAYSLCSRNVDWSGMLKGFMSSGVTADVGMQFSVWNPNRFEGKISAATIEFLWKGAKIGVGTLNSTEFPAGCIVDFPLDARFTPGPTTAALMFAAYSTGALFLDVQVQLDSTVHFSDGMSYTFSGTQSAQNIDVAGMTDRSLCLC